MFEKLKEFVNAPIKDGVRGTATVVSSSMPPDNATSSNCKLRLTVAVPGREPYNVDHTCLVKLSKWPWPGTSLPVSVDPAKPDHLRVEWDEVLTSQEELDARYPVYGADGAAAAATTGAAGPAAAGAAAGAMDPAKMAEAQAAVNTVLAQNGMAGQGVVDLRGKPEVREQMFAALEAQGIDTSAMRAAVAAREAGAAALEAAGGAGAAAGAATDPLVRLEKLGKLRDSGVLTADEFEAQKKRILEGS